MTTISSQTADSNPASLADSVTQFILKGTTYSLLALILVRVLTVIGSIAVARILGKVNLGMLSIVNNLIALAGLFATVGIPTALTKYVAEMRAAGDHRAGEYSLGTIVGTALGSLLVPLGLVAAAIFFSAGTIAQQIYHEPRLAPLIQLGVIALLISALGSNTGQALLQGLKEVKRIALVNIITSAAGVPIVIVLTLLLRLPGAILAQVLTATLILLAVLLVIHRLGFRFRQLAFERRFLPRLFNLAFPAFISGLVMTPALWITTTRLQNAHGFADVGLFNICYGLFQLVLFLPMAVGMPLVPVFAERSSRAPEQIPPLLQTATQVVAFISLVFSAAIGIFARPLIQLLYGPDYLKAALPMSLMSGAVFFTSIGWVLGHYFAGTGRLWTGMKFNLCWLILLLASAWLLIPAYGALGLTAAFLVAYGLITVAMLGYARMIIGIQIGYLIVLALLSLFATGVSSWFLIRPMAAFPILGTLALLTVAGIGYWRLPAKPALVRVAEQIRSRMRG